MRGFRRLSEIIDELREQGDAIIRLGQGANSAEGARRRSRPTVVAVTSSALRPTPFASCSICESRA